MAFSLGLGLTNACDLACAHCYRPTAQLHWLSFADVASVCTSLPIRSVNLGTGENGLHPDFRRILRFLNEQGYKVSITSNGYSIGVLADEELRLLHDVELSLDFPTEAEQDAFRAPGNWRRIVQTLQRCQRLGVVTTIVTVLMNVNYRRVGELARVASSWGASLRVNVYQPVRETSFTLTFDEFWEGFRRLFAEAAVVACSEPVVGAAIGQSYGQCACGRTTVRVSPEGHVLPCVYWPSPRLRLADLQAFGLTVFDSADFRRLRAVPPPCASCPSVADCGGGCASRRALMGRLDHPDPYCPRLASTPIRLSVTATAGRDLPKIGSACTTIVRVE